MLNRQGTVWVVRAGQYSEADELFLTRGLIAIGLPEMGDLSGLPPTREAFKAQVTNTYPDIRPGAIPLYGGLLYRFVYDMRPGDIVVYPSKRDLLIHIGYVVGAYVHAPAMNSEFPNQRRVEWVRHIPRSGFSAHARQEIGSVVTLFQVNRHGHEFLAALESNDI